MENYLSLSGNESNGCCWRDLIGLESTSASAAWSAAFDELLTNSEAELPT